MNKVAVIGIAGNSVYLPVENFHIGGETLEAQSVKFEYGGKGFNQAVAAARWGAEVSFLAAIGKGGYDGIKAFLDKENIHSVLINKDTPSAFAAIITDKNGANRVTVYQGAQLSKDDVKAFEDSIKNADILLLNNEVDIEVMTAAAEIAKKYGVKIILNPAPYRKTEKSLLDSIYLFTPNEHEAADLDGYKNVIKTLGKDGCYIKWQGKTVPAKKVRAVDTTGAGDTFSGVLAAELAREKSIDDAVISAVKASGDSVTKKGAVSSIPYNK